MKELSIEEKAKAYDDIIKKANKMYHENCETCQMCIEELIPELKESEDERVRKFLIGYFDKLIDENSEWGLTKETREKIITWLEKQGEHADFRNKIQIGDKVTRNQDGVLVNLSQLKRVAKPADKVEPKFHEGDWIKGYYTIYKVLSVNDKGYVVEDVNGNKIIILFENEKFHHLWTIKDARNGDVLACNISYYDNPFVCIFNRINETCDDGDFDSHCYVTASRKEYDMFFICRDNDDREDACVGHSCQDIHPANYYEKKLLFDKMREAGYEWDAEKKELKKIEQKPVEPQQNMLSQEKYANAVGECIYGEQKPTDKVEPKFKVGDIIRHKKQGFTCKIDAIDTEYRLSECCGTHLPIEWQDAYELVEQNTAWSEKYIADVFEKVGLAKIVREQNNDNLTNALQDAMIELSKFTTQPNTAWSEEDENMLNHIINDIESLKEQVYCKNLCNEEIDWLKSLKERYTWKPSNEQMRVLDLAIRCGINRGTTEETTLVSLFNDLKKLREE